MIDFKMCCLCMVLVLPGSVERQLRWSGKFYWPVCRVIPSCFHSWYKKYKNQSRKARVIIKNKVACFLWLTVYYYYHCCWVQWVSRANRITSCWSVTRTGIDGSASPRTWSRWLAVQDTAVGNALGCVMPSCIFNRKDSQLDLRRCDKLDGQLDSAIVMLGLRHLTVYVKQPMNSSSLK